MASYFDDQNMNSLLAALMQSVRRKIFVSYHHGGDQTYYNEFSRIFHDGYETIYDNSLEREIDSENVEYVIQRIRDEFISGTSCTVLLIGSQTYLRKYVDWEIKATLDKEHGLVGIALPSCQINGAGQIIVPARFHDNAQTGYAKWDHWGNLTAEKLNNLIDVAIATPNSLIANAREMRQRNG